jgi:hypothetical protein
MRGIGVAMFLLGSTTLLATLSLPDPDTSDHPAIKLLAGLLALGARCSVGGWPGRRPARDARIASWLHLRH